MQIHLKSTDLFKQNYFLNLDNKTDQSANVHRQAPMWKQHEVKLFSQAYLHLEGKQLRCKPGTTSHLSLVQSVFLRKVVQHKQQEHAIPVDNLVVPSEACGEDGGGKDGSLLYWRESFIRFTTSSES